MEVLFFMTNFEFLIDGFMLYCTSKNLSKKSMMAYEQTLKLLSNYMCSEFKITDVQKTTSTHIRYYIKYLKERGKYTVTARDESVKYNHPENRGDYKKQISMSTVSNYVRNIKVFFNWLHDVEGEIKKNPIDKIENIKSDRKVKKMISVEEFKRIFNAFDYTTFHGYRNLMITKLLFDTGMRIGECLDLESVCIDFMHKSILIKNAKSRQQRYVYFGNKMSRELKAWMKFKDRYVETDLLFSTKRGTFLSIHNYEKSLKEAGVRVGVEVHPHQLRNNFAKYYILNGGDWFTLCRILGHSSVEVTQKAYLDFTDEEVGKKYQRHSPLTFLNI